MRTAGVNWWKEISFVLRAEPMYLINHQAMSIMLSIRQKKKKVRKLITQLSQKNQTNAIIWGALGVVQIIIAMCTITYYGFATGIWTLVVGILNVYSGYKDFTYSKDLLKKPVAIISRYESATPIVVALIYNLIFGGIIGIVGSLYEISIRNFVLNNKTEFEQAEKVAM